MRAARPDEQNRSLFIVPRGEGHGFQARVRGHVLDLIDPSSYALSPTTDDLFIVSMAAALAWSAQTFLRDEKLPEYVSVSAAWCAHDNDPPTLSHLSLTVTVSPDAASVRDALAAALENRLASRSLVQPVVHVSSEEE
jgi:hypothetical protein